MENRSTTGVTIVGGYQTDFARNIAKEDQDVSELVHETVTATLLDGLVIARSAFHHSMNYRSVVVRGVARRVDDTAEIALALRLITNRVGEGRWDDCRRPDASELARTAVMAVPLAEASAKVRVGDPVDDDADLALGHWAGVVPMETRRLDPVAAADLVTGPAVPAYL